MGVLGKSWELGSPSPEGRGERRVVGELGSLGWLLLDEAQGAATPAQVTQQPGGSHRARDRPIHHPPPRPGSLSWFLHLENGEDHTRPSPGRCEDQGGKT